MKKQPLMNELQRFVEALTKPVAPAARVKLTLEQARGPCVVRIRVRAAPTKLPKVQAQLTCTRTFLETWQALFPTGRHVLYDPAAVTQTEEGIEAWLHLPGIAVED